MMRLVEARGLWVEWKPLGAVRGYYEHHARTITLNSKMPGDLLRSTLAHELGHAHYGHVPNPLLDERQEQLANRYAADLLITDESYARAERTAGHHRGAIAVELEVALYIVDTWRAMHRLDLAQAWEVAQAGAANDRYFQFGHIEQGA